MAENSKIEDGGPAFPEAIAIGPAGDVYPGMGGMSLRDYIAIKAMSALLQSTDPALMGSDYETFKKQTTIAAYEYADAMIKARLAMEARD